MSSTGPVIVRLGANDPPEFANLVPLAEAEGFRFLTRAKAEWAEGSNLFDGPGEGLFIARLDSECVAMAGISVDPFLGDPTVGRLRRVYVAPKTRGQGIGRRLVVDCLQGGEGVFSRVRLRTTFPDAARLYEGLGFVRVEEPNATHSIDVAGLLVPDGDDH